MGDPNGGRIARGWHLLGVSARFLAGRPSLFIFPALSGTLLIAIATAFLIAAGAETGFDQLVAIALLGALPATFVVVSCNVAFLTMVQAHMDGRRPRVRDGLAAVRANAGPILRWSALTVAVGAALRAISALPGGGLIEGLVSWLGGLAWSLATYFVVPVLVLEQPHVVAGVKRSVQVFRQRWGESLTGDLTAGAATGIVTFPGMFVLGIGAVTVSTDPGIGVTMVALGLVLTLPPVILATAVTEMFQLVVYREAMEGQPPAPFTTTDTGAAFKPRRRWLRRR